MTDRSGQILLIEDDDRIAAILVQGLELRGYEVTVATSGFAGRDAWATGEYQLILLDVMLPEIDGVTLCARLREDGDTTPVIMLTARDDDSMRERAMAAGANDYVGKPFAYADLIASVQRFLPRVTKTT